MNREPLRRSTYQTPNTKYKLIVLDEPYNTKYLRKCLGWKNVFGGRYRVGAPISSTKRTLIIIANSIMIFKAQI
jgi:hypothetical protein